jgi:hypothetical protein
LQLFAIFLDRAVLISDWYICPADLEAMTVADGTAWAISEDHPEFSLADGSLSFRKLILSDCVLCEF